VKVVFLQPSWFLSRSTIWMSGHCAGGTFRAERDCGPVPRGTVTGPVKGRLTMTFVGPSQSAGVVVGCPLASFITVACWTVIATLVTLSPPPKLYGFVNARSSGVITPGARLVVRLPPIPKLPVTTVQENDAAELGTLPVPTARTEKP